VNKYEVFELWAPDESIWSQWVKPVLFAHMPPAAAGDEGVAAATSWPPTTWLPAADGGTALVLDVPCDAGVWLGLRAAEAGYRPVPLYNSCPAPFDMLAGAPASDVSLVNVAPIIAALSAGAPRLAELRLPPDEPPAFLLDANRRLGRFAPRPGKFDNRSVSLPTDFPGANLLLSRGVRNVLLVQAHDVHPQPDLAHTLRRWSEAGVQINAKQLELDQPIRPCVLPPARSASAQCGTG
jgi:hypothetical protein